MSQKTIHSHVDVHVKERNITIFLRNHGKLGVIEQAIQIVQELSQVLRSVWLYDKSVIHIPEAAQLVLKHFLQIFHKEFRDNERKHAVEAILLALNGQSTAQ
jgi:hypothetical protein